MLSLILAKATGPENWKGNQIKPNKEKTQKTNKPKNKNKTKPSIQIFGAHVGTRERARWLLCYVVQQLLGQLLKVCWATPP